MTNLLPPAAKKQVIFEYWTRMACAWVMLWSICLCVGVVLLWPTYVLLTGSNDAFSESASAATERTNEYDELSQSLTLASKKATDIVIISEQPLLSAIIDDIWSAVDETTIRVNSIQVQRDDEGDLVPFVVGGEAANRQSLAQFRDALEALPFVASVDLPIENLAKNEDIAFVLTVAVANETL